MENQANAEAQPTITVKYVVPMQAFSPENCPDLVDSDAVAQVGKATGDRHCWSKLPM